MTPVGRYLRINKPFNESKFANGTGPGFVETGESLQKAGVISNQTLRGAD